MSSTHTFSSLVIVAPSYRIIALFLQYCIKIVLSFLDLSRYVDKLIILLLLRNDTTLIIEMVNLILKYNFPLNAKTCRMLITTLIHIDEKLAMQLYCYAEAIGFYSTLEVKIFDFYSYKINLCNRKI